MLRSTPSNSPQLSVLTDDELEAIDTAGLIAGDLAFSQESGEYILQPGSSTALSATVKATSNSNAGASPGRWIFTGLGPSGPTSVPTITSDTRTTLSAFDTTSYPDQTNGYTTNGVLSYWTLDKTSALTADNTNVLAATPTGRWIRRQIAIYQHIVQTAWYVDSVNGNDGNDGLTSGTALATIREWYVRTLGGYITSGTTLNILGTSHPSSDLFCYWPNCRNGSGRTFLVKGTRTTTASGTYTSAATVIVPSTNTPNTATDTARTWVAGQRVVSTSGAVSGALSWVNLNAGGGVAQVSRWCTNGTVTVTTSAAPAISTTYSIVSLTSLAIGGDSRTSGNGYVQFQDFSVAVTAVLASSPRIVFMGCSFPLGIDTQFAVGATFADCDFSSVGVLPKGGSFFIAFGQARGVKVGPAGDASMSIQDFVCEGAGSGIQADIGGTVATTGDVMVKNATTAVAPTRGGRIAVVSGTLSGAGNTTAVAPRSRGTLHIFAGYQPTITGSTEISWTTGSSIIQPLVAGASVPAVAACNTWTTWAGGTFLRRALDFKDFAAILTD